MYIPAHFKSEKSEDYQKLIHHYPLALMISHQSGDIELAELPLLLEQNSDGCEYLSGHFSANNPFLALLTQGQNVSCVFRGPSAYISPQWLQPGAVPTWNYITVKVEACCEEFLEGDALWQMLRQHTLFFDRFLTSSWFDEFDPLRRERVLSAIVGVRFRIVDVEAKFKLSQNRSDAERQTIIQQLAVSGESQQTLLAQWMS